MVAEPCVDAEMAHEDGDEIEKQMGSGVDRAERRHDKTDHESKSYVDRAERRKHDETEIEINDENVLENHGKKIEASKMQIIEHEIPQIQYQEVVRHVTVPQIMTQEVVRQVPVPQPFVQAVEETFEVPQVQYSDRIVDLPVVMQCQIPTIRAVQRAVEVPQVQFCDRVVDVPVVMQVPVTQETIEILKTVSQDRIPQRTAEQITDTPVPQVAEEFVEVFNVFSQNHAQQRIVEQITETPAASLDEETMETPNTQMQESIVEKSDVPVPHVMEEVPEVEKLKSQLSGRESTLLADKKPASKLNGGCAAQAPECEELQGLRDEGLVAIHDINKLPNDNDSLELFKETFPSQSLMQLQGDKRGVVRRARAVVRKSSGSPGMNLISMAIGIGRAEDADTSLAIDTKSHESTIADPTAAAQHPSTQQHNYHRKQWQQTGQTEEGGKEEKAQGEREKRRKDEGGRDPEGRRKEKEREPEVKKYVTDWTVVTKNRRQRKTVQIFVKVNGSKEFPLDVSPDDREETKNNFDFPAQ